MGYTLKDFLASPLAEGCALLAGAKDSGGVIIESVSVQELPVDDFIRRDELVLSTAAGCLDDLKRMKTLLESVSGAGAAALFFAFKDPEYRLSDETAALAEQLQLPLYSIPWERRFADVQAEISSRIREEKLRVFSQLQEKLFNGYFEGDPIGKAAENIGKAFCCKAVITDGTRRALTESFEGELLKELEIAEGGYLSGYLQLYEEEGKEPAGFPSGWEDLLRKYVCFPLSLWFNRKNIEDLTIQRLKNDFVWELAGGCGVPSELIRQGNRLGFDLGRPYCCVILKAVTKDDNRDEKKGEGNKEAESGNCHEEAYVSAKIEDLLIQESQAAGLGAIVGSRGLEFVLYLPNSAFEPELRAERALDRLQEMLAESLSDWNFYWGISEINQKEPDFPRLYRNASLALACCLKEKSGRYRFTYKDTKEAQIAAVLSSTEEIKVLAEEILQPLLAAGSGADLTGSLAAYIRCNYKVSETARSLHIHRQSLLYRLERIKMLTGMSLEDHKDLFLLEIGLRALSLY